METDMIKLGNYSTDDLRQYSCYFFKELRKVVTIGPLPGQEGDSADMYQQNAGSEDEARKMVTESLGPGWFLKPFQANRLKINKSTEFSPSIK